MTEYVLVPGAWHGAWAWRPVATRLRAAGHGASSLTIPGLADGDDRAGRTMDEAVDAIVRHVTDRDLHDVVLVGHSWAGFPITGAAARLGDRVAELVYVSAFVPSDGVGVLTERSPQEREMFEAVAAASDDDSALVPFEVWSSAFVPDVAPDAQRMLHELLVPQPMAHFREPVDVPADLTDRAIRDVALADDLMFPLAECTAYAQRLGTTPESAPGGHEALLTHPDALAEVIAGG